MELGVYFLDAGKECRARNADNVCDGVVGVTVLPKLSNAARFRHQHVQPLKKLIENDAVGHDGLKVGIVRANVANHLLLVVERKVVPGGTVLADGAVAAAEPPLAPGAGTAAMTVRLTEGVPNRAVELVVDFVTNGNALLGGGFVDEVLSDFLVIFIV